MNALPGYWFVSLLARRLPRQAAYAAARWAAAVAYRCNGPAREALAGNLRVVLASGERAMTEGELQALVRWNFANFGKYVIDFFRTGELSPEGQEALIRVEGFEYVRQCLALDRGVIGLTAHIGNWELGAVVLGARGLVVNAVVRSQPGEKLDALFQGRRLERGLRILPMDGAAGLVPARLKQKEFVVLLADLDFTGSTRRVPFFGRPARLPQGPAVLAKRTGAPILPAFVLRQPDDTFCFRAYPPIIPQRSESVAEIQHRICGVLEEVISAHPDQWFAFGPLWDEPEVAASGKDLA